MSGVSSGCRAAAAGSSDSSSMCWSRCSSPQLMLLVDSSPGGAADASVDSTRRGDWRDGVEMAATGGDIDDCSPRPADTSDDMTSSPASAATDDVFSASISCDLGSPSSANITRGQHDEQTGQATRGASLAAATSPRSHHRPLDADKMSRSMDEVSMKSAAAARSSPTSQMQVSCSSPELSERQRSRRSFAEDCRQPANAASVCPSALYRHSTGWSANSRRPRPRREHNRIAARQHRGVFTAVDSSEPQLLSLRRFCDDYRNSCLQQQLTARRRSLDVMLQSEVAAAAAGASHRRDRPTSTSGIH